MTLRARLNRVLQEFDCPEPDWELVPRYNVAPTQEIPIVREIDGKREIALARWGMMIDTQEGKRPIFNARSETVTTSRMFKHAFLSRRCLVPADGFYEWRKIGKKKWPTHFHKPDNDVFAFAGLWWNGFCTILTTEAADWFKPYHDRMPVILARSDYPTWLDTTKTDLAYLYQPFSEGELVATAANPIVNSFKNEGPECLDPVQPEVEEPRPKRAGGPGTRKRTRSKTDELHAPLFREMYRMFNPDSPEK